MEDDRARIAVVGGEVGEPLYITAEPVVGVLHHDDVEARIFYALSLLATADGLDKTYKNQLKAGAILEQVFAEKPQHRRSYSSKRSKREEP